MKKEYLIVIVLTLIIVALLGVLFFVPSKKPANSNPLQGDDGIQITSPLLRKPTAVSSPLKVSGMIMGNGWVGFEGQVGTVKLLDGNGKEITSGILKATTDWMTFPVNFETILNFKEPETKTGILVFKNENPSGIPEKDRNFFMQVGFSQIRDIELGVFFVNSALSSSGEQDECKRVYKVLRYVPETKIVAEEAIKKLLGGPTDAEMLNGYFTSIPVGSKLNSISIENGVAKVDFNATTESGGGSCSMSARVAQITQTLLQFPTIKSVKISIDGRTGDIFQP